MVLIKIGMRYSYDQDGDEPASWYGGDDCNDLDPTADRYRSVLRWCRPKP